MNRETMHKVISPDGTSIAYYCRGVGSPLVLVHGSGGSNPVFGWTAALPALEARFSVYAIDRRGYRESGDSHNYTLEHEVEDIVTVVNAVGEPSHLLGHSFGALCALEAALLIGNLRKLILYEPAMVLPGIAIYPAGFIDRLQSLLEAGDREGVLSALYHEIAMMSLDEIEQLKASPAWPGRIAAAHNVIREARVEEGYVFDKQCFKAMHAPTLLLLGGDSSSFIKASTQAIAAALPNSRVTIMPGQQHIAMYTAPHLFVHEVLRFLLEPI